MTSLILKHPLSRDAGGDISHGGGRHCIPEDPDWLTMAEWVRAESRRASDK